MTISFPLTHLVQSTDRPLQLSRPHTTAVKMRLTAELITSSLTYLNPLKERELDLRGTTSPTSSFSEKSRYYTKS